MDWYLVQTMPRQEFIALDNLKRQGYAAFLPVVQQERLRSGKVSVQQMPPFPRYLFVKLEDSLPSKSWAPIRSTRGVSCIVHFGCQPARVDSYVVARLKGHQELARRAVLPLYQPGERVRILDGPFRGLEAVFSMRDGSERAVVLLDVLSRPVTERYTKLQGRGATINKVCVAVARELAGFVWAMARNAGAPP